MKRKIRILCILVVTITSLSVSWGCEYIDNNIFTSQCNVVDEINTSKVDYLPFDASELTLENGTGIIYIGMHRDDVIEQFDEWNLNYELSYSPEISDFSSITVNYGSYCYRFDREGHLESVQFDVTPSGLAYGDTVEKMIEIYGTDYLYSTHSTGSGSVLCYYTYSFSASTVFTVEAYGEGNDGTVMRRAVGQKD